MQSPTQNLNYHFLFQCDYYMQTSLNLSHVGWSIMDIMTALGCWEAAHAYECCRIRHHRDETTTDSKLNIYMGEEILVNMLFGNECQKDPFVFFFLSRSLFLLLI